ncbi:hypothetical protein [Methylibium sp. Pch-M]|uniref:hypothetical protein n=1 Tax=Methylibium sp. Pch-M TaxID=2082386 RepID=UPI0013EDF989|nr:hypothetical protein [Methylibium sp. Pch-M]
MQFKKQQPERGNANAQDGHPWGCLQVVAPTYGTFRGRVGRSTGRRRPFRTRPPGPAAGRSFLPRSLPQWIEIPEHFSSSLPPSLAQGRFAAFVLPIEALADPILTRDAGACIGVASSVR